MGAPKTLEHRAKIAEAVRKKLAEPAVRERIRDGLRVARDARACVYCELRNWRVLERDGEEWACIKTADCEARIVASQVVE